MTIYEKGTLTALAVGTLIALVAVPLALRKVRRNVVYGYRTPATLANDDLWFEANACFGRWLFVGSLLGVCLAFAVEGYAGLSPESFLVVPVVAIGGPVVIAGVRTSLLVRRLERGQR